LSKAGIIVQLSLVANLTHHYFSASSYHPASVAYTKNRKKIIKNAIGCNYLTNIVVINFPGLLHQIIKQVFMLPPVQLLP